MQLSQDLSLWQRTQAQMSHPGQTISLLKLSLIKTPVDNFIILNYNLFIVLSTLLYIVIPNCDNRKEGKALRILFFSFASIP